jgi:molecular chaperone DnaK (HSP70)
MSQYLAETRTSFGAYIPSLKILKNRIRSTSICPTIVVLHDSSEYPEFKSIFNSYSKIYFHKENDPYNAFLHTIQKQKKKEIPYEILPIFGRILFLKYEQSFIQVLHTEDAIPFEKEYNLLINRDNCFLRVYETETLIQTININEKGFMRVNLKIDTNGIYNISLKKIETEEAIPYYIPQFLPQKKAVYKIPLKQSKYERDLNAVGIDLGTGECCAFVFRRDGPDAVALDNEARNLPSYVAMEGPHFPCGQVVFNRMETKVKHTAFDVKYLIGKKIDEIVVDPLWPFVVVNHGAQIRLIFYESYEGINKILRTATPGEVYTYLLYHIKKKLEEYQGTLLKNAVIAIPSSFTEEQKDATIHAANICRWTIDDLLPEPIAALIAYSYETEIPNESTVLLFDCGDGTTDICIAKIVHPNINLLTDNGDASLGGKKFDKLLITYCGNILKERYGVDLEKNKYRLMRICRKIKHDLSVDEEAFLYLDELILNNDKNKDDHLTITREQFEEMSEHLMQHAVEFIQDTFFLDTLIKAFSSPCTADMIDIVYQVGGGCRMPMIKKMLKEVFPGAEHHFSLHLEELVAKGAALYHYEILSEKNPKRGDIPVIHPSATAPVASIPLSFTSQDSQDSLDNVDCKTDNECSKHSSPNTPDKTSKDAAAHHGLPA